MVAMLSAIKKLVLVDRYLFVFLIGKEQVIDGAVAEEGSSGSAVCWSLLEER